MKKLNFLDLFAGAGGLSEGFIQAGFSPIAHIESDTAACFTLRTRTAYHWLAQNFQTGHYEDYLQGKISRAELYSLIPDELISAVIEETIDEKSLKSLFTKIDILLKGKPLDLIIGGPPCQAYSLAGRSRDKNRMKGDYRNFLYKYYTEFLKKYQPRFFVFENVLGLLSATDDKGNLYYDQLESAFFDAGYTITPKVLTASDYGVLQKRRRVILLGNREGVEGLFPEPEKWKPNVHVWEIFSDLPKINAGKGEVKPIKLGNYRGTYLYESGIRKKENDTVTFQIARPHNKQDLKIYSIAVLEWNKHRKRLNYDDLPSVLKSHKNKDTFTDRFKVVAGELNVSHTVVAHIAKDGHYYIHPDINQNRSLTPREAARLQTFPDDYFFESVSEKPSRTAAFRQIGNAVPVLLANKIANKLKELWNST